LIGSEHKKQPGGIVLVWELYMFGRDTNSKQQATHYKRKAEGLTKMFMKLSAILKFGLA